MYTMLVKELIKRALLFWVETYTMLKMVALKRLKATKNIFFLHASATILNDINQLKNVT